MTTIAISPLTFFLFRELYFYHIISLEPLLLHCINYYFFIFVLQWRKNKRLLESLFYSVLLLLGFRNNLWYVTSLFVKLTIGFGTNGNSLLWRGVVFFLRQVIYIFIIRWGGFTLFTVFAFCCSLRWWLKWVFLFKFNIFQWVGSIWI